MAKFLDKNGLTHLKEVIISKIPTKVSDLNNDSGFITSIPSEYVTDSELNTRIPNPSSNDNDKVLSVVNGQAAWIAITNSEGVKY